MAFDGDTASGANGVWVGTQGNISLLALEGLLAPGTPPGVTFNFVSTPRINAAGHVAFNGDLTGPGGTPSNNRGVFGTPQCAAGANSVSF